MFKCYVAFYGQDIYKVFAFFFTKKRQEVNVNENIIVTIFLVMHVEQCFYPG